MIISIDKEKARFERKFYVEELTEQEIEAVVKLNSFQFSEIFYERMINSLYLDTLDFSYFSDNVVGNSQRMKYRIRWYGETFGKIEKPVLEIKIRDGQKGSKLSFPVKPFTLDQNFTREYLFNILLQTEFPLAVTEILKDLQLASLNRYKRKYFLSHRANYRITIDWDLEFFRVDQNHNLLTQVFKQDGKILELKYPSELDDDADQITNQFPFRLTKSSKYVNGRDFLYF